MEKRQIKRSIIRLLLGRYYYNIKRCKDWYLSGKTYTSDIHNDLLAYVIYTHKTPLLRKLKYVEMYLQYNKEGVGGGLCRLSNLIYWMTLHTVLTVTERHRHSHDIFPDVNRTQPFGTGATCSYNSLDLQIYNGTNNDFQLIICLTKGNLEGEWRSSKPSINRYEVYEKEHSITPGLFGGYIRNNAIYRRVYNKNIGLLKDEYITENHAYMTYSPYLNETADISD